MTSEQRRAAKAINFGLIYGMGAFGLAQTLGISTKEAEQFIDAYFARYAGVQRLHARRRSPTAERDGRVETLLRPRRATCPSIQQHELEPARERRAHGDQRPIQGTAADLIKLAMIARRPPARAPSGRGARLLLTGPRRAGARGAGGGGRDGGGAGEDEMEGAAKLDVPLVVDTGIGPNWGSAKG